MAHPQIPYTNSLSAVNLIKTFQNKASDRKNSSIRTIFNKASPQAKRHQYAKTTISMLSTRVRGQTSD